MLNISSSVKVRKSSVPNLRQISLTNSDLSKSVIVLDTLKKFGDMMNKSKSKLFNSLLRTLTTKGITVVCLAHTNKHDDKDGKPIFEGTGDLRNDFDELIKLFTPDGALQPPFQRPIVGKDSIYKFFQQECQNLKLVPEKGISEPAADGFTQIKVTGKVQTPWFGSAVGMNISWRFLLTPENRIFFVAIDLLASPKELLNLIRP
jgi:hypothetical protein